MNPANHVRLSEAVSQLDAAVSLVLDAVGQAYPDRGLRPHRAANMLENGLAKLRVELTRRVGHEVSGEIAEFTDLYGRDQVLAAAGRELVAGLFPDKAA